MFGLGDGTGLGAGYEEHPDGDRGSCRGWGMESFMGPAWSCMLSSISTMVVMF